MIFRVIARSACLDRPIGSRTAACGSLISRSPVSEAQLTTWHPEISRKSTMLPLCARVGSTGPAKALPSSHERTSIFLTFKFFALPLGFRRMIPKSFSTVRTPEISLALKKRKRTWTWSGRERSRRRPRSSSSCRPAPTPPTALTYRPSISWTTISLPSSVRASAPAKRPLGKRRPLSSTTCGRRPPPKASRSLSPAVTVARPGAISRRASQPLTDSPSTVWPPRLSTSQLVGRSSTKTEPTAPTGRPPTGPINPQRLAISRKQPGMRAAPTPRSAAFSRCLQPAADRASSITSPPGKPDPAYPTMASAICPMSR